MFVEKFNPPPSKSLGSIYAAVVSHISPNTLVMMESLEDSYLIIQHYFWLHSSTSLVKCEQTVCQTIFILVILVSIFTLDIFLRDFQIMWQELKVERINPSCPSKASKQRQQVKMDLKDISFLLLRKFFLPKLMSF